MKRQILLIISLLSLLYSCRKDDDIQEIPFNNPILNLKIPTNFPQLNPLIQNNFPTKYGVELGEKLFYDKRLSNNNTISCATCHQKEKAYADSNAKAIGIDGRIGLRNTPPIQNLAFLKIYMWDGAVTELSTQPLIPIITHEEMDSNILEIIDKIKNDTEYQQAFKKAFGDSQINGKRILESLTQFMYTLISANSKYDKVQRKEATFTDLEQRGYNIFEKKCSTCHSGALLTDQSFRNIGFPINPNTVEEHGLARVTGKDEDIMKFRVPSLRNIEYTAPYGSFGEFQTLRDVLDYFDNGVKYAPNLDNEMKKRTDGKLGISLSEDEKNALIAFLKTLSDKDFIISKRR